MPATGPITLAAAQAPALSVDLLIVFATATIVTLALRHLRVATIPAYLVAGAIIGPALGLVAPESVEGIASLAIILLMFGIGLHMDLKELRGDLLPIFGVGAVATLLVMLIVWPVAMLFGLSPPAALAVGMAISMSSTAAVLRTLQQRREMKSFHGRVSFGVLIVQDLLTIVFLALIPTLGSWTESLAPAAESAVHAAEAAGAASHASTKTMWDLLLQGVLTIAGVAAMIAAGRIVLPRLLAFAAKDSSPDVLLVVAGAVAMGAAVLTGILGLSPELGAFVAGFLLAGTPFKHQVSGQLTPMRDLFMAIFFVAVGLNLPLQEVISMWWVVLLAVAACIAIKTIGNAGALWLGGLSAPVAFAVGLGLSQAGEFTLVILQFAEDQNAIDQRTLGAATGVVAITLMLTPALMSQGRRLGPRLAHVRSVRLLPFAVMHASPLGGEGHAGEGGADSPPDDAVEKARVIIAGFGPVGRAVAQRLDLLGAESTVIELNPATVKRQGGLGRRVVYGDVTNPEVLESAGAREADAFILTIPDDEASLRAVRAVRDLSPTIFIAARASFLSKGLLARQQGADHVTIEEIATAESMAEQVQREFAKRRAAANGQEPELPSSAVPPPT
ncbi:MAG: cation:proton antiporter [Phycisphaeraceae bacterium]|nr:cation:proton antiporter [Phycisphaeraceae bacterium]